ncbi:hypothetical protein SOVF_099830 [Spinacia oleracea]|nr:hypothetical protein SOVF_099830 [Spinacia oleracea]
MAAGGKFRMQNLRIKVSTGKEYFFHHILILHDAITSESSISALDSSSDFDPTVSATLKPPLILRRSSSDSGPCEITSL